ncbi:hypothetical protein [Methanosphaera sp.]|uniref:hypothetical protein n=1 Tax=Methanosphaera sp. TaxID=2666342 RepID=UPI002E782A32|nr:hypothetical protein [Methanosphaera sp.]MEE1117474.1 hypothetical protein [Methanosphaera sp.]
MFFFFLFVILLSCSIVTAEDITDNILTNEYQNHNDTSRTINFDDSEGLSNQEDTYSKYYFATESEMDSVDVSLTEEDKDEKLCTDFNQNKDDIYSNDAGLVFFDEDVINYSSIDEKYISVRNYYSNVSFTVEEIGFFC